MRTAAILFLLVFGQIFLSNITKAQPLQAASLLKNEAAGFIENKGQVSDQKGRLRADVKYIYSAPGFKLILKEHSYSFELYTIEKTDRPGISEATGQELNGAAFDKHLSSKLPLHESAIMRTSRIDVELPGSNSQPEIIADEKRAGCNNYYLAHTPCRGVTGVYSYSKITYRNIFDHIDFVFYARPDGKLKYDIVIRQGGKAEDVKMAYKGIRSLSFQNGSMSFCTSLGRIQEEIPRSYYLESGKNVTAFFSPKGNCLSFHTAADSKTHTLIIDPAVLWATYYGGSSLEFLRSVTTDKSNNIYVAGNTLSASGIATTGAYQSALKDSGVYDAYMAKFSPDGKRLWATYYGGHGADYGEAITMNAAGNIIFAGYTESKTGIITPNAFDTTFEGAEEAFLAKFNSSGQRVWATYYGGNANEGIFSIVTNASSNIYVAGTTSSTSGMASSGAFRTSGQGEEAFLAVFSDSGSRKWGTYFGSVGDDINSDLAVDSSGNIFLVGSTSSYTGLATSGAFNTTYGSLNDGYLAKFNSSGSRLWATYIGGSSYDDVDDIEIDGSGNLYFTGSTYSASDLRWKSQIATAGAFNSLINGKGDIYIEKFTNNGAQVWGTYFGGPDYDYGWALVLDKNADLYISGNTASTTGITDSGSWQPVYGGGTNDAVLAKFSSAGKRVWATYFGGNGDDAAKVTMDASGFIVLAGGTASTSKLATSGAYQTKNAGRNDVFIARIDTSSADAGVYAMGPITVKCAGSSAKVYVRVKNYSDSMSLSSVSVGWSLNGIRQTPAKYTLSLNPGDTSTDLLLGPAKLSEKNTLKIWTYRPDNGTDRDYYNDTLYRTIHLVPAPAAAFSAQNHCQDSAISFINTSTLDSGKIISYVWDFGDSSTSIATNPTHKYSKSGAYTVMLTAESESGCIGYFTKTVTVYEQPNAGFTYQNNCLKSATTFYSSYPGFFTYTWNFGDGNTAKGQNVNHTYMAPGTYTVWHKISSFFGCVDSTSRELTISAPPDSQFTFVKVQGRTYSFSPNDTVQAIYHWRFDDSITSYIKKPTYTFKSEGSHKVSLTITDSHGCSSKLTKIITVNTGMTSQPLQAQNIKLYPNPFSSTFMIEKDDAGEAFIEVFNMKGERVFDCLLKNQLSELDLQGLSSGIYLVRIYEGENICFNKIMKE